MYWINPATWWINGVLAATLGNVPVICQSGEATIFNPPSGQTCGAYARAFIQDVGTGYITNPGASSDCGYCQYASGEEYLATLSISPSQKWRDFGVFLVFVCSNWVLVYFFIYTTRVKGWTFGFGPLFGGLGKMVGMVKGLFQRKNKEEGAEK